MFNELNPLWLYTLLAIGLVFSIRVAMQHISDNKRLDSIETLLSVLAVYKRQLKDYRNLDVRLLEEIHIYEGQSKQIGFEKRLIDNVNKENVIIQELYSVLAEIHALDPSNTASDFILYRNEVKRISLLQSQVNRLNLKHRRNSNQHVRAMG